MLYNLEWEKKKPIADLLNRAADILDQRGHVKETLRSHDGKLCALASLMVADGIPEEKLGYAALTPMSKAATDVVGESVECDDWCTDANRICNWNNRTSTTKEVVVNKFREVAAALVAA